MKNICQICDAYDGTYCRCTPKKLKKSARSWCRDKFKRNLSMQCGFCSHWKNAECDIGASKNVYDVCERFEDKKCITS
jgi:hypothetical protein